MNRSTPSSRYSFHVHSGRIGGLIRHVVVPGLVPVVCEEADLDVPRSAFCAQRPWARCGCETTEFEERKSSDLLYPNTANSACSFKSRPKWRLARNPNRPKFNLNNMFNFESDPPSPNSLENIKTNKFGSHSASSSHERTT